MTDRRYVSGDLQWFEKLDEDRMVVTVEDEDGEMVEVPIKWEVCGSCDGRGKYVNPNVDSDGIPASEFNDDPDFAESYFGGCYDVTCGECLGRRVVPAVDDDKLSDSQEEKELKQRARATRDARINDAYEAAHERAMGY